jgi:hypothetical protein
MKAAVYAAISAVAWFFGCLMAACVGACGLSDPKAVQAATALVSDACQLLEVLDPPAAQSPIVHLLCPAAAAPVEAGAAPAPVQNTTVMVHIYLPHHSWLGIRKAADAGSVVADAGGGG